MDYHPEIIEQLMYVFKANEFQSLYTKTFLFILVWYIKSAIQKLILEPQ